MNIVKEDIAIAEELVHRVLGVERINNIERMGGLTNRTYKVTLLGDISYVVRIPGEGTEEMINRENERVSTMLACQLGIDALLLYFGEKGEKVSCYIDGAQTLSPEKLCEEANLIKAASVLYTLHHSGADTKVPFDVFDMAESYENVIRSNNVALYEDYAQVKSQIMEIKRQCDQNRSCQPVPCHNDPLCENWVLDSNGKLYLIDWEYAGMNDGMWDLADVSIEASLTAAQDNILLKAYFNRIPTVDEVAQFQANKLYLDYLWTLWGKTRVPFDGEPMEQYAAERYERLKRNMRCFEKRI